MQPEIATSAPQPDAVSEDGLDLRGDIEAPGVGPLVLRLFGPLGIEGSGGGDGLNERPTRGLIVFLALKRAPASLDELSEALWPDESPTKTRPRLWKAKRQAQRLLGDALLRRGDAYELNRTRVRFDADEFDGRRSDELTPPELDEAIRSVEGAPLADVDYPWADGERRRLQAIQADLFARGATARLEVGDGRGALAAAERLIESDSLNEQGWRIAMEAEALLGQRQAVLDRFERLRGELDERLGLRPQAQTLETYHRLLGQA
jgi:DNA-binding SARP family transcriptional activator